MNAILIDPKTQTVRPVQVEELEDFQTLIGGYIEATPWGDGYHTLYVDEEGLFKDRTYAFRPPSGQWLVGCGVLVGRVDRHGNDTAPQIGLSEVAGAVQWGVRAS